jgi:hypothetical protein
MNRNNYIYTCVSKQKSIYRLKTDFIWGYHRTLVCSSNEILDSRILFIQIQPIFARNFWNRNGFYYKLLSSVLEVRFMKLKVHKMLFLLMQVLRFESIFRKSPLTERVSIKSNYSIVIYFILKNIPYWDFFLLYFLKFERYLINLFKF